jgi:hypothetical protein
MVVASSFAISSLSKLLELIHFFIEIFFNLCRVHNEMIIAENDIIPSRSPVIVSRINIDEFLSKGGIWVHLGGVVCINETVSLSYHPSVTIDDADEDENPHAIHELLDQFGQANHLSTLSLGHLDLDSTSFNILELLQNWVEDIQNCSGLFDEED